jgi:hypothetical protein
MNHHIMMYLVTPSLGNYWILFSTYKENLNNNVGYFVEDRGLFFRKVAYSKYDEIKMFLTTIMLSSMVKSS